MTRQQLIEAAYDAIGYRPTRDDYVYNDRIAALEKMSDEQLMRIIENKKP
jgi:hypothetical protein